VRDITVTIQRPEMRELARRALAQGFRPGGVRKHGLWLMAPDGVNTVNIAHTTGDRRASANVLAELKRFGFKDEEESKNGRNPNTSPLALKVVEALVSQNKPMTAQELSAMVNEPWALSFADLVRHMADAGQIERYKKITMPGSRVPYRANVYVHKGYTQPAPSAPQPVIDIPDTSSVEPEPRPEPPPQPLPPAAEEVEDEAPWRRTAEPILHRIIDKMVEVAKPVHMYELIELMGEPVQRAESVGSTLSSLSRQGSHPYNPLGKIRKRDRVQRPGHVKPIVRYEWVPNDREPEPQPQPPEPQMPSPASAPDEEVPVAATTAANTTAIEVVPTTGRPVEFWLQLAEDVCRGLAYGLSRAREREREGGVG
jgi:hypothetical protein